MWRIRQVAVIVTDLAASVARVEAATGLTVCHRSASTEFATETVLLRARDTFLELVSPTSTTGAAARYLDRHGDGGYLLILQTDDWARTRARVDALGARVTIDLRRSADGVDAEEIHLHPKDTCGAAVAFDVMRPAGAWLWAGTGWEQRVDAALDPMITGVEVAVADPVSASQRWRALLGLDECADPSEGQDGDDHGVVVDLGDGGRIRFVPSTRPGVSRVVRVELTGRGAAPVPVTGGVELGALRLEG